ncbi:ATP/GTP-binding protein [Streptomyces sp. NPDC046977]|uniref:ATP/GTP-binding protein n=1 Tax=Streptomyces sp. NPDC046977 TaxID=3154703 RepID=UPI0033DAD169
MDPRTVDLASSPWWSVAFGLIVWTWHAGVWLMGNAWWLALIAALVWAGWEAVRHHLAEEALKQRMFVELVPSGQFETNEEEILRFGAQLIRAASAGKWWAPRHARTVRIRLRADGSKPLTYRVEGPASAQHLLQQTPYARVQTEPARPVAYKKSKHTVRAVFALHGTASSKLREVPLQPDPLQPLIDAVADLRSDLGDLAEVCLDLSPASKWGIKSRRWHVVHASRQRARQEAQREARWMAQDSAALEDSWGWQLTQLLAPPDQRGGRRLIRMPRPPRIDREKALGKLMEDTGLVRVQLLVRCSSEETGRAERRLRHIEAALDVFAARTRLSSVGWSWGPVRFGPDSWPWRSRFDRRWASGLIRPGRDSWVRMEELAGLLKPPTMHARLPLMAGDIPTYVPKSSLLPQGWHRGPDGTARLLATRESDTLFEVQVGKAGWGKTTRALVQAVAVAHHGGGLAFVDPHRDSWATVAPYLAHDTIMERTWLFDLTVRDPADRLASWNPLSMTSGAAAHEVTAAVVDAFATSLGWGDANAPRAITILTKAVEALVAVNAKAVAESKADCQATVFQMRPLLTDATFRALVIARLTADAQRWWTTSFPAIPADALPTVLNPLDRLAASPVIKAFLGSPTGSYDMRRAMDESKVVWICPAGTGPTDRLLTSMIVRDMLRAGLSRRDLPEKQRTPFRLYLDELISLDGSASTSLAEITEQLRKFGVRMHGMTQLLHRISPDVRTALLQNASSLSTTAGSTEAVRYVTNEWGDQVSPADAAELGRYQHWASFTVGGTRVGPLRIRGPELNEVFGDLALGSKTKELQDAADTHTDAKPLAELTAVASTHEAIVRAFLTVPGKAPGPEADTSQPSTSQPSPGATRKGQFA